ncbi:MAG: sigma-70 family RNA polymerase sigma factor [Planctomycetes bacterium]|nr:sigma-70 family RNA polymerase sigma factor [Planctomycetota bacterium]
MPRTDAELLRDCQGGSPDAFRELVERYQQRVFWTAKNVVNSRDVAQDITQDAFLRIHQAIHSIDANRKFFPYLYQVVVNLCIDHLRKEGGAKKVSVEEIDDIGHRGPGPADHAETRELKDHVHSVLARLPAKYRMVMTLRDIQGYTCEEISDMLKINSATLRWRLHMARKYFKEIWESVPRPTPP